jgi:iron(III) transport system permease protein
MISCSWLERPGAWRVVGVAGVLILAALPALPLFLQVVFARGSLSLGSTFGTTLWNSFAVAIATGVIAFALGLPAGVLSALYEFRGRAALLALAMLPALVPSFLWAIGWASLTARIGPAVTNLISGQSGCVLVFLAGAVPLVLIASYVATTSLSGSQIDAARLAGGEKAVLRYVCGAAAVPAALAAVLSAILTLSDPGPGQILGLRTAASEVLTSFSALYDFNLAGRQCAVLAMLVLLLAAPLAWLAAPRLSVQIMARQTRSIRRPRLHRAAIWITASFTFLVASTIVTPILGLVLPLLRGTDFAQASGVVGRTGANTLLYAGGAGVVAALLALLLALFVGRDDRLRTICLGVCLAILALPPALGSLGIMHFAAGAPAWADPFLRSRATVCFVLGLRFLPVAVVLAMRAWQSIPVSWVQAAELHGVSLALYVRKVAIPFVLPTTAAAIALVALLATADVGTVLLLHPPGKTSFPLAIFTVMANAPESLVASLCLAYLGLAAGLLAVVWTLARRQAR